MGTVVLIILGVIVLALIVKALNNHEEDLAREREREDEDFYRNGRWPEVDGQYEVYTETDNELPEVEVEEPEIAGEPEINPEVVIKQIKGENNIKKSPGRPKKQSE